MLPLFDAVLLSEHQVDRDGLNEVVKSSLDRPHHGKLLFRLLVGCTVVAWGVQTLSYIILAGAQGPIEVRHAIQLTTPLGGLIWLASLTGLVCFIVIMLKKRSSQKKAPNNGQSN